MIIAGLVLKLNRVLTDIEIIELLKLNDKIHPDMKHMSFDELTSDDFNGLGIIHLSNQTTLVIHRNLGYTCQFEGNNMYGLDLRLQSLSQQGQILCYLSNPYSATFGYAYFKDGIRKANEASSNGEKLEGNSFSPLGEIHLSESGILDFAQKIGDFDFSDLIEYPKDKISCYS